MAQAHACMRSYVPKNLDIYLMNWTTPPSKPSIKEPAVLELETLPSQIRYALVEWKMEELVSILRRFKKSIGWSNTDIIGIPLDIYTFKSSFSLIIFQVFSISIR